MVGNGNSPTSAGALADRDVLVEGGGTLDRWLVDLLMLPYGVGSAVAGESALLRALLRIADRILDDVVLNQRAGAPAVDGK